jgi:hypothetical protein
MKSIRMFVLFAAVLMFAMAGCKGESPTDPGSCSTCNKTCTTTVQTSGNTFPCAGGSAVVTMTTSSGCNLPAATASVNATWASYTVDSNNSVTITATANNSGASRTMTATVDGQSLTYTQPSCATASCTYAAIPTQENASCAAGDGSFAVIVTGGCEIHPSSDSTSWLTITPSCSTCSTVVYHKTSNNTNATRVGHITVGSCTYTVTQEACPPPAACAYDITPKSANFFCGGPLDGVLVVSPNHPGCPWSAVINDSFIHFTGSSTGTDTASVPYRVDANNTGVTRTGTITAGGQTLTISQASCAVPPTSCTQPYDTPPQTVTDTVNCPFGGTQSASITVFGHGSGTASNCSDALTQAQANAQTDLNNKIAQAHIDAKAQAQAKCPSCTLTAPSSVPSVSYQGTSNGSVVISVTAGNSWTATSASSFVHVTTGSGTGNGTVTFTVDPNSGSSSRAGVINITACGNTTPVSVPQDGAPAASCDYLVPPSVQDVSASGTSNGSITFQSTTPASCTWTASADSGAVSLSAHSGSCQSCSIQFTVGGNAGAARDFYVTIVAPGGSHTTKIHQLGH